MIQRGDTLPRFLKWFADWSLKYKTWLQNPSTHVLMEAYLTAFTTFYGGILKTSGQMRHQVVSTAKHSLLNY